MRGALRMWASRSSAERRGESTDLRVKKPVVHSRSRRIVHASPWDMGGDCRVREHLREVIANKMRIGPMKNGMIAGMGLPVEKEHRYTVSEYLEREKNSLEKHEYRDGDILLMAGGTLEHGRIAMNIGGELRSRL